LSRDRQYPDRDSNQHFWNNSAERYRYASPLGVDISDDRTALFRRQRLYVLRNIGSHLPDHMVIYYGFSIVVTPRRQQYESSPPLSSHLIGRHTFIVRFDISQIRAVSASTQTNCKFFETDIHDYCRPVDLPSTERITIRGLHSPLQSWSAPLCYISAVCV
jgi:hypothetical protein